MTGKQLEKEFKDIINGLNDKHEYCGEYVAEEISVIEELWHDVRTKIRFNLERDCFALEYEESYWFGDKYVVLFQQGDDVDIIESSRFRNIDPYSC